MISPHFYRIFSERPLFWTFRAVCWLATLAVIGLNMSALMPSNDRIYLLKRRIVSRPFAVEAHIDLAKAYWNKRMLVLAQQELSIARDLLTVLPATNTSVLGTTSEPEALEATWGSFQDHLIRDYDAWTTILIKYPDYRDGFLQLSTIAFQLGKTEEALRSTATAAHLDPNFPLTQTIREFLSQNHF